MLLVFFVVCRSSVLVEVFCCCRIRIVLIVMRMIIVRVIRVVDCSFSWCVVVCISLRLLWLFVCGVFMLSLVGS